MQNLAAKVPTPRHFPITVEIYHLMAKNGAFHPDDRVELIGGEIFEMSPVGSVHIRCVNFLNAFLARVLGDDYIVSVQNPIVLDDESEPQPDISVLKFRADFYRNETPKATHTELIIEVADTSVEFDRSVKIGRYAVAGVPEAWLIDLANDRVEVRSMPLSDEYGLTKIYTRGENAVSEKIPSINLPVDDVLG
jgi:Uma2 family endonuclease